MAKSKRESTSNFDYVIVGEAVRMCLHHLEEDLKEKLLDFSIFDDNVEIPGTILSILWSTSLEVDEHTRTSFRLTLPCNVIPSHLT